jgi:hypothetical protein
MQLYKINGENTQLYLQIQSRSIHSTSSRCVSRLIIADNNLGLVSIYGDRHKILSHKLLVRKKKENTTKIWETITELGAW